MTFTLPPPEQHAAAELVLKLRWPENSGPLACMKVPAREKAFGEPTLQEEETPERALGNLLRAKGIDVRKPEGRATMQPASAVAKRMRKVPIQAPISIQPAAAAPEPLGPEAKLKPRKMTRSQEKLAADKLYLQQLCAQYQGRPPADKIPGLPKACSEIAKR